MISRPSPVGFLELALLLICFLPAPPALGQFTHTRLKSFGFANQLGAEPFARIMLGSDGAIYGTTLSSGGAYEGTVFKVNRDGAGYRVLHGFTRSDDDGATPYAELIEGSDGALYGTTRNGGITNQGAIFKIEKDGAGYTVIHRFNSASDGANPTSGLIEATDGLLYGTAHFGGSANLGTVFRVDKDGGNFKVLHHFTTAAGGAVQPVAGVIEGSDGLLYGTTYFGGDANSGAIFRLSKEGTGYRVLRSFIPVIGDGASPYAGVIEGADRVLYGTTQAGGKSRFGTIYKINRDGGGFRVLHSFTGTAGDGAQPFAGLREATDGLLYGVTAYGGNADQGTVFKINKAGSGYAVVRSFVQGGDANLPHGGLIEAGDGTLFGATQYGGPRDQGAIFKLNRDGSGYGVLYSFSGGGDASHSYSSLQQSRDGSFIGTTWDGGSANLGTVFKLNKNGGDYTILHSFAGPLDDGANPFTGVIQASDGVIYGTTIAGGSRGRGTVFRLNHDGSDYRLLHSFTGIASDGMQPYGGLVEGGDGALYGATAFGGSENLGTVFKIQKDGSGFALVRSFSGSNGDGQKPYSNLLRGSDGALYGTTAYGGNKDYGTVFKLFENGSGYTVLRSFSGDGDGTYPFAMLAEGSDRALYGITAYGGAPNLGTVFRLTKDGADYQVLRSFTGIRGDAAQPASGASLVEGGDGALYGTTYLGGARGVGTVFKLNKDGSAYEVIFSFSGIEGNGANPFAALISGEDGALYATTQNGGAVGSGTVFRIAPAARLAITPTGDLTMAGPPGFRFTIQYLDNFGSGVLWQDYAKVTLPASPAKLLLPAFGTVLSRIYRARLDP